MRWLLHTARAWLAFGLVLLGFMGLAREAGAQTTVQVLDSFPAGSSVTLAPDQNFYLRLAYSTDKPTHIWIRPFFRGREVLASTSVSRSYAGTGEKLAWFSVRRPGVEVDEIRIKAGDGRTSTTPVIATHAVRVAFGGSAQTGSEARPNWLVELDARDKAIRSAGI